MLLEIKLFGKSEPRSKAAARTSRRVESGEKTAAPTAAVENRREKKDVRAEERPTGLTTRSVAAAPYPPRAGVRRVVINIFSKLAEFASDREVVSLVS